MATKPATPFKSPKATSPEPVLEPERDDPNSPVLPSEDPELVPDHEGDGDDERDNEHRSTDDRLTRLETVVEELQDSVHGVGVRPHAVQAEAEEVGK